MFGGGGGQKSPGLCNGEHVAEEELSCDSDGSDCTCLYSPSLRPLIHPFFFFCCGPLTPSKINCIHSLTHSLTPSFSHSLTHSLSDYKCRVSYPVEDSKRGRDVGWEINSKIIPYIENLRSFFSSLICSLSTGDTEKGQEVKVPCADR